MSQDEQTEVETPSMIVTQQAYTAVHVGCGILGGGWSGWLRLDKYDAERDLRRHLEMCNVPG